VGWYAGAPSCSVFVDSLCGHTLGQCCFPAAARRRVSSVNGPVIPYPTLRVVNRLDWVDAPTDVYCGCFIACSPSCMIVL
jgi:hypothetical protein